jgi:OmpA-OmpF porin, OOP family
MIPHFKRIGLIVFFISMLFLVACSTTPPNVQDLPVTANPTEEIKNLEENLAQAHDEQVYVLSPDNYKKAEKQLKEAKEARGDNKSNEEILKEVSLGNAWLTEANKVAKAGADALPEVVEVRARALEYRAGTHANDQLKKADKKLSDFGEDFEDGDYAISDKDRQDLLNRYMEIELAALKGEKIGQAYANINQAESEGAKDIAPKTLALAHKKAKDAESFIVANRQDMVGIDRVSSEALNESERVLNITREAKITENKSPEQLAIEMEAEQRSQQQLTEELSETQEDLETRDSALAVISAESSELESQVELDNLLGDAREQFDEDEAEVFRQGDSLIIRLKGVRFTSGQSFLTPESYPLMTKVQNAIKMLGEPEIEVQGHTDSLGSREINERLSEERADSVRMYLIENGAVDSSNISIAGFGDQRPLATNRTKEGREQNRRVDIIITPQ